MICIIQCYGILGCCRIIVKAKWVDYYNTPLLHFSHEGYQCHLYFGVPYDHLQPEEPGMIEHKRSCLFCIFSPLFRYITCVFQMLNFVVILFLEWLLIAEDQGIRVFDHNISKLHAKAMMYKSRVEYELPVCKLDGKTQDNNVFFYTDNEGSGEEKIDGDQEMIDSLNAAMLAAARTVNLTTDGRRKRKGIIDEGKTQFKFGKYHLLENSFGDNHLPFGDDGGSSSGSEVENPVSDEDMEIMEQ